MVVAVAVAAVAVPAAGPGQVRRVVVVPSVTRQSTSVSNLAWLRLDCSTFQQAFSRPIIAFTVTLGPALSKLCACRDV